MREKRRLKLVRQQLLLAKLARREALAGLAEAVTEEDRSASLATKSSNMLADYSRPLAQPDANSLRDQAAFVRSLRLVVTQAQQAHRDASDQTQWQARTLAAADTKSKRVAEQVTAAKKDLEAKLAKTEASTPARMARKLQSASDEAGPVRSAPKRRGKL